MTREQFSKDASNCPHVQMASIRGPVEEDFGGRYQRGGNICRQCQILCLHCLINPSLPIQNHKSLDNVSITTPEQVARFQVSVQHICRMHGTDTFNKENNNCFCCASPMGYLLCKICPKSASINSSTKNNSSNTPNPPMVLDLRVGLFMPSHGWSRGQGFG